MFVTVNLPLGLETPPAILMPEAPLFSIVISPLPKFLTAAPLATDVPVTDLMEMLPLLLTNWLPEAMLSVLTSVSNKVFAAVWPVRISEV